ncbi:MAG: HEAT repeat domain-containing protein [Proteobacteria bacterium]|nr:HEAT repeat domain-containing protein [Pseudomonadota bacterium]MBU1709402.1 HEAT repeat domain-containing protein [Pseudomonadota bacterium]
MEENITGSKEESPIIKLVDSILTLAAKKNAEFITFVSIPSDEVIKEKKPILSAEEALDPQLLEELIKTSDDDTTEVAAGIETNAEAPFNVYYNLGTGWFQAHSLPANTKGPVYQRILLLAGISPWEKKEAEGKIELDYGDGAKTTLFVKFDPGVDRLLLKNTQGDVSIIDLQRLLKSENSKDRQYAADELLNQNTPDSIKTLKYSFENEKPPETIFAYAKTGAAETIPELTKLLRSPQPALRAMALKSLVEFGTVESRNALLDALQKEQTSDIVHALGDSGDPSVVPTLQNALKQGKQSLRLAIFMALAKIGTRTAFDIIEENVLAHEMQEVVLRTLPILARKEPDVRIMYVQWLYNNYDAIDESKTKVDLIKFFQSTGTKDLQKNLKKKLDEEQAKFFLKRDKDLVAALEICIKDMQIITEDDLPKTINKVLAQAAAENIEMICVGPLKDDEKQESPDTFNIHFKKAGKWQIARTFPQKKHQAFCDRLVALSGKGLDELAKATHKFTVKVAPDLHLTCHIKFEPTHDRFVMAAKKEPGKTD